MQSLEAMEGACDGQMKQRGHIIEDDGHLSYKKMETTSFLMPPLRKSWYKSLIASVQETCN